ncbi:MAG: hypothetical protein ACQES0_10385 [Bacteroidota bacterium]
MLNKPGVIIILSTLFIGLLLSACSKYDDPAISLRSKNARVDGQYVINELVLNPTQDVPSYFDQTDVVFMEEGGGEMSITLEDTVINSNFQWEFDDSKEKLRVRRYFLHKDTSLFKAVDSIYRFCFNQYSHEHNYPALNYYVNSVHEKWGRWGGMMEIIELSNNQMRFEFVNDSTNLTSEITLTE